MPRFGFFTQWFRSVSPPTADGELLSRFANGRDESAFAELVERHGPIVYRVCRRIVGQHHDAEDAFQATFLVLARKAGRIGRPELVGNWLYGVAVRVATKARRRVMKRNELTRTTMPERPASPISDTDIELAAVIDMELAGLSARFRDAILLCDVQSLSRSEAAERLGIPEGTLSSRLNAGRKKLAARLTRRGIAVPAVGATSLIAMNATTFAVPIEWTRNTLVTVSLWLAGGRVPLPILELTTSGVRTMKFAFALTATVFLTVTTGVAVLAWPQQPVAKSEQPQIESTTIQSPEKPANEELKPVVEFSAKRNKVVPLPKVVGEMNWLPDGKSVVLSNSRSALIISLRDYSIYEQDFEKSAHLVGLGKKELPALKDVYRGQHNTVFLRYIHETDQINGDRYFERWWPTVLSTSMNPKNDKNLFATEVKELSVALQDRTEVDEEFGEIVEFLPDGKHVMTWERGAVDPSTTALLIKNERSPFETQTKVQTVTYSMRSISDLSRRIASRTLTGFKTNCRISPDGNYFATSSVDILRDKVIARIELSDVSSGKVLWTWNGQSTEKNDRRLERHTLLFSNDSQKLLVQLPVRVDHADSWDVKNAYSRVFDVSNVKKPVILQETSGFPRQFSNFSHDNRFVVGSNEDIVEGIAGRGGRFPRGRLAIWDTMTGLILKTWEGYAVGSFSPADPQLAILETMHENILDANGVPTTRVVSKSTVGFYSYPGNAK